MADNLVYQIQEGITESVVPAYVTVAIQHLQRIEPVAGTVSSKGSQRWGWTCEECQWVWYPPEDSNMHSIRDPEEILHQKGCLIAEGWKEFPNKRCGACRSHMKRWQTAKRVFVGLEEHRINQEIEYLRFITWTRREWNIIVPPGSDIELQKNKLKKKSVAQFRLWRQRNQWWISKEANGQYWPECTEKEVEDGTQLHFHIHAVVVCGYLDNRPIRECCWKPCRCKKSAQGRVVGDSRCYKEWGGIMDVRAVKDFKVPYQHKGETRYGCGRKACMRYLSKYISKARGWRSVPIGKWKYGNNR